jgi:hypothetical protein
VVLLCEAGFADNAVPIWRAPDAELLLQARSVNPVVKALGTWKPNRLFLSQLRAKQLSGLPQG